MSHTRKQLLSFIEEARAEREAMQRDLWRAIEERNIEIDANIALRKRLAELTAKEAA